MLRHALGVSAIVIACCVSAAQGQVVINEVLYNPAGTDLGSEKIEIKNLGGSAVDLTGWRFCVHIRYTAAGQFNGVSINPGQIITLHLRAAGADDANNIFLSAFPPDSGGNTLENFADSVALYDCSSTGCFGSLGPNNRMIDYVQWGDDGVSANQERHNVAADPTRPGGPLWSSAGLMNHAPQTADGMSIAYDGSDSGAGETTLGVDYAEATPSIGLENSCSMDGDCDDGVACTDDACDEGTCTFTPNNELCADNGAFCDGSEFCDASAGCQSTGSPCAVERTCNETADTCDTCVDANDCDDGVACTDDDCVAGDCVFTPNDANCPDDGLFCNGTDACDPTLDCVAGAARGCPAGQLCDEATDSCAPANICGGLELVASGLISPVLLTHAGDGSGRLFVVDQVGTIRIIDDNGTLLPTPFLDLTAALPTLGTVFDERGLLGLAFHPDYASNGRFFVRYSVPRAGDPAEPCNDPGGFIVGCHSEVLSEFAVSADPNVADAASEILLYSSDQPQFNHDAGHVAFGPDGFLYFGLGDGGGANDGLADVPVTHGPIGNGQNIETDLGSMIRIDVDGTPEPGLPYAIPGDNPFVGVTGVDEIYAYGLRNPYRFSFDAQCGDLYVADVGQDLFEELNLVQLGGNYGWVTREGMHCFDPLAPNMPPATCATTGPLGEPLIDPVSEYSHAEGGTAIIGGYVYRGFEFPQLQGKYVYGDFSADFGPTGRLYYLDTEGLDAFELVQFQLGVPDAPLGEFLKGLGEDEAGELYVLTSLDLPPSGTSGSVYRLTVCCEDVDRCADTDQDGVTDDSCKWHDCVSNTCNTLPRNYADMGGAFGVCPIDGFANIHDRNHVLTCFAGLSTCEPINIDAGGSFGACPPDGFCNIHDANHALTSFAGTNTCTCPPVPAPQAPITNAGTAELALAVNRKTIFAGDRFNVEIALSGTVEALRSYQLELITSGGTCGALEVVDIFVEPRRTAVFASREDVFSAFNPDSHQMLSGLDLDEGVSTTGSTYLATFTLRATRKAMGSFVIDLAVDEGAGDQTYLVAPDNGRIEIAGTTAVVVNVAARRPSRQ
jgi:glucose/arabinose dehydrogenase